MAQLSLCILSVREGARERENGVVVAQCGAWLSVQALD